MIDPNLQKELRERFNPEGSDLRKMQLRMLDMLMYIDRICTEHGIKYWLSSGTCIGAIRHGGFIPWDDDVDVEMEYRDYKKLARILRKQKGRYVLQDAKSDPHYPHAFPKLRDTESFVNEGNGWDELQKYSGIYIDIFTIEPSNSLFFFKGCAWLWINLIYRCKSISNEKLRRIMLKIFRSFLKGGLYPVMKILNIPFSRGRYRHSLGSFFNKPRFKDDFSSTVRVPFEGISLPVPVDYDKYLRRIYGDYSKIPDINHIQTHLKEMKIF